MRVRVSHNGDDVFVAWKPDGVISGCRGFALLRQRNGVEETVSTWVGFEGDQAKPGERRPSTAWPIQRYQWTDYMAKPGDRVRYQVVPMVGPDKQHLTQDLAAASEWTDEIELSARTTPTVEAYFNRGIVAAQWVTRRLGETDHDLQNAKLTKVIATPGDPFRDYLAGPLGARLFELLSDAHNDGRQIFAALYELDDPQLIDLLEGLGERAHVVLANGSVKKVGEDQNAEAASTLQGKIDLHRRMVSPRALGHNKFLVLCDDNGEPRWVWTGSQNWTETGLCTQANNSVLIDDPAIASEYRRQWDLLRDAGDRTPDTLLESNSKPRAEDGLTLWFTPTIGQVDLDQARSLVANAQQGILFLMFNPGPRDTLLNTIIDTARAGTAARRLYVRGVLNQDPSTSTTHVELFDQRNSEKADFDIVLPAAIDDATEFFERELKKLDRAFAMVHSKVIVVDPFGDHPVVLTGSHNLGPKASGTNDENLLIFRDAPPLAAAYATNIMAVYNQYRWRFRRHLQQPASKRWKGLQDNDTWQAGYLRSGSDALDEIDFWAGG